MFFDIDELLEFFECVIVDFLILFIINYNCLNEERNLLFFFVWFGGMGIINFKEDVVL